LDFVGYCLVVILDFWGWCLLIWFVFEDEDGMVFVFEGELIGIVIKNVVEYSGLIVGLRKVVELQFPVVEVVFDLELMVKQMWGEYCVKNVVFCELLVEVGCFVGEFGRVEYCYVKRVHNEFVDKFVNDALDAVQ